MPSKEGLHLDNKNDHHHHPELHDSNFEESFLKLYHQHIAPLHKKTPKLGSNDGKVKLADLIRE